MGIASSTDVLIKNNHHVDSSLFHMAEQRLERVHSPLPNRFITDKKGIVAVIPAYNEERFIGSVVLLARQHVETVIVIDDGSSDHTALLAESAGATVVTLAKNGGKGTALRKGLELALQQDSLRAIVLLDADGQHDAREVPAVVGPVLDAQADLVIGSRFLEVRSEIPWWRQVGQHGLTWMTNMASSTELTDSQSGFRALSPAAARLLLTARSNGFSVESEMQFTIREHKLQTMEVPISCVYEEPPKRNPIAHGLQVIDGILRLVAQMRPLLFFGLPSLFFLLVSLVMGGMVVQTYNHTQELAIGYALMTVLLTVVGAIGLSSGIVLHSVRALLLSSPKSFHSAPGQEK